MPALVPLAAVGLAIIMAGAATVSSRRRNPKHALLNLLYLAMAIFLAWVASGPGPSDDDRI
jgi:uncharacterized membrane protein YphA (DoxX/SURF4 family)